MENIIRPMVPVILILTLLASCTQPFEEISSDSTVPSASVTTRGDFAGMTEIEHFSFLPPIAELPETTGSFVGGLEPVVRISLEDDSGSESIVEFSRSGKGSEKIRESYSEDLGPFYLVNFHLHNFGFSPGDILDIEVILDSEVLGSLRCEVRENASNKDAALQAGFYPLGDTQTLPIKFRIDEEYFNLAKKGRIVVWAPYAVNQAFLGAPEYVDFTAIAVGSDHGVGLRSDGSLVSWGADTAGQVSETPDGYDFVAVSAGVLYSMALRADGTVVFWGGGISNDQNGRAPAGNGFKNISAGISLATAISEDGGLRYWGPGGQLESRIAATAAQKIFEKVFAGYNYAFALDGDGTLYPFCNASSGLGSLDPPAGSFVSGSVGYDYASVIDGAGNLILWGDDAAAASGLTGIYTDGPYTATASGRFMTVAVRADGSMNPIGDNAPASEIPADPDG